jgi:hypothetical protein
VVGVDSSEIRGTSMALWRRLDDSVVAAEDRRFLRSVVTLLGRAFLLAVLSASGLGGRGVSVGSRFVEGWIASGGRFFHVSLASDSRLTLSPPEAKPSSVIDTDERRNLPSPDTASTRSFVGRRILSRRFGSA